MSLNEFARSITSSGSTNNLNYGNLSNFLKQPNNNFVAHQIKSGTEFEISKKADGGEQKIEFMLQVDPTTGQSTKVYVRTLDEPGGGSESDKGLEFSIPKELLLTNDPILADKIATQYANMVADLSLQYHESGKPIYVNTPKNLKWSNLIDQKIQESFLNRANELNTKNIPIYVNGNQVYSPQKSSLSQDSSIISDKKPSLLFKPQKKHNESMIEKLLKMADEMKINPEIYLKGQGINPEHPANIELLCQLAKQDNKTALTVLESVIENQNNSSPLAQKLLAQVKKIKLSQSQD